MTPPGPLVYTQWYDPTDLGGGWKPTEDVETETPQLCSSVGWLLRDDEFVIVAACYGTDTDGTVHVGTGMVYPKACEVERRYLSA